MRERIFQKFFAAFLVYMKLRSRREINGMANVIQRDLICQALGLDENCEFSNEILLEKIRLLQEAATEQNVSREQDIENTTQANGHANNSGPDESLTKFLAEFKSELPFFYGNPETEDAFDFIESITLLCKERNFTEEQILKYVLPRCLRNQARDWWNFKREAINSFLEFKKLFLQEYFSINYEEELKQMLQNSFQNRAESMGTFIRRVSKIYDRLENKVSEQEKVNFVLQRVNPEYRAFLFDKTFSSLREMETVSLQIQKHLLDNVLYAQGLGDRQRTTNPLAALQGAKEKEQVVKPLPSSLDSAFFRRSGSSKSQFDKPAERTPSKTIVCYTCSKIGHYSSQCRVRLRKNRPHETSTVGQKKERMMRFLTHL